MKKAKTKKKKKMKQNYVAFADILPVKKSNEISLKTNTHTNT